MITQQLVESSRWPIKPLGQVVEFLDNLRKPVTESLRKRGEYTYYGANGPQGTIDEYLFDEPTILLAEDGGFFGQAGRTVAYQVEGKYWVNNHAHVLRPRAEADIRFLCRQLEYYDVSPFVNGTTRAKLTKGNAERIPVALPPLAEQKRIAAILDKADAIRRRRQEAARLADTLIPSVFYEMFGDPGTNTKAWPVVPLSHFVAELQGGKNIATDDSASPDTKYVILKVSAVTWGQYSPDEAKPVPPAFEPPPEYFVRKGDLLITRANTRELIGATAYVSRTPPNVILPDKIWRFVWRSPRSAEPLFVHHLLKQAVIRAEIGARATGTSGSMKNISMPKLLSVPVPLPPLELQRRFVTVVEEHIELQQHSAIAYRCADEMFNSLVQRAFRGEL